MIDFACKTFKIEEIVCCGFGLTKSEFRILIFLLEHKKNFRARDIFKRLKLKLVTVQKGLKHLYDLGLLKRLQKNLVNGGYIYFYHSVSKQEIRVMLKRIVKGWAEGAERFIDRW